MTPEVDLWSPMQVYKSTHTNTKIKLKTMLLVLGYLNSEPWSLQNEVVVGCLGGRGDGISLGSEALGLSLSMVGPGGNQA